MLATYLLQGLYQIFRWSWRFLCRRILRLPIDMLQFLRWSLRWLPHAILGSILFFACREYFGFLVGIQALLLSIAFHTLIFRLFHLAAFDRAGSALVARQLALTIEEGGNPVEVLRGLTGRVGWTLAKRLSAAAKRLESPQAPSLAEVLREYRLLEPHLAQAVLIAESLGPAAMSTALRSQHKSALGIFLSRSQGYALLVVPCAGFLFWFLTMFLMPKFDRISWEIGTTFGFERSFFIAETLGIILVSILLGFSCLYALLPWWRSTLTGPHRLALGRILAQGLARGQSETALATALSRVWTGARQALMAAGSQGNLGALCRVCGWQTDTQTALSTALQQEERRNERNLAIAELLGSIVPPLVFAVVVALVTTGFFSWYAKLVITLAGYTP